MENILVSTFDVEPIARGATGEIGLVTIDGNQYVFKRSRFKRGGVDHEMRREIKAMKIIRDHGPPLLHTPKYGTSMNIQYQGDMYTFIVMTEIRNHVRISGLSINHFLVAISDVFNQLNLLRHIGISSHNDLHTGNVLVQIANPNQNIVFDDFRSNFIGFRSSIIDFGRISFARGAEKNTTICTDIVALIMSYIIYSTGFLLDMSQLSEVYNNVTGLYEYYEIDLQRQVSNSIVALIKLCDYIIVRSMGVRPERIRDLYQGIRDLNRNHGGTNKMSRTVPPWFFFQDMHFNYIDDGLELLRSEESIANCRKGIADLYQFL